MKFRRRTVLETRPGVRERPSRHARALERSAFRLRAVREEVTVPTGERDMKDSCRVRRKLGDESGDTGDGVGSTWLDVREGERALTAGAERGGWCEPAAGLDEDEAGGKREGLGIKMGGGARCSLRCWNGTLGRAEEGAGLGDGRVRRESREGRRAGAECGAESKDGKGWSLRLPVKSGLKKVTGSREQLTEEGLWSGVEYCQVATEAWWNLAICCPQRGRAKGMSEALCSLPRRGSWRQRGW